MIARNNVPFLSNHFRPDSPVEGYSPPPLSPDELLKAVYSFLPAQLHITMKSNVFMLTSTFLEIEKHNKTWLEYTKERMKKKSVVPQDIRPISNRHFKVDSLVLTWLLGVDLILLYRIEGEIVPIIIKKQKSKVFFATVMGRDWNTFTVDYQQIVKDPAEVETILKEIGPKYEITGDEQNFYTVQDFKEACPYEYKRVYECVKPGQWCELQDAENPNRVVLTQIVQNRLGLLLVKSGDEQIWIHVMDRYLHEVGWVAKQSTVYGQFGQKVCYAPGNSDAEILKAALYRVPTFVFRYNYIPTHRLNAGDIVVVTDHKSEKMYYSHVVLTEDKSDHFFHLAVGNDLISNGNGKHLFFHIYHPRIFSLKRINEANIRIRIPSCLDLQTNETTLQAYKRMFSLNGRVVGEHCGNNSEFIRNVLPEWEMDTNAKETLDAMVENVQFVEVLRKTKNGSMQLTGAIVVALRQNILKLKASESHKPFYLHCNDINIFNLGACKDIRLAVSFNARQLDKRAKETDRESAVNGFFF